MSGCADYRMLLFFSYVAATILDTASLYVIFFPLYPGVWSNVILAAGLHLCAFAIFLTVPRLCRSLGPDRKFYYFLTSLFTLFLPGVGVVGSFFSCLTSRHLLHPQGLAGDFEKRDFLPYYAEFLEDADDIDHFLEEEISVQPIMDIIMGSDTDMKRGAIRVLRNRGTPESVRMLKLCLSDSDVEVRFLSHTALGRLEEEYVEAIDTAKKQAGDGSVESLQALAKAYENYAFSELLGEGLRASQIKAAIKIYESIMAKNPEDLQTSLLLGELNLELGDHNAAAHWLTKAWQPGETYMRASLAICRLMYERREMTALRGLSKRMAQRQLPQTEDSLALSHYIFWTAGWNPDAQQS